MNVFAVPADLLSSMLTPAVLISACGTLILSTSLRLARIVDRVRELAGTNEQITSGAVRDFLEERRAEVARQLSMHARRAGLIQWALTSFYIALCLLVATMSGIGLTAFLPEVAWLPTALGIAASIVLLHGCIMLIGETRLALKSVLTEMEFITRLGARRMNGT